MLRKLLFVVLLVVYATAAYAQDGSGSATDDDVNRVASKLYCPVCENITLDVCGTAACDQWREEIRDMLAQGMTDDQIIASFVQRFGDRVVGTPQDPLLRGLSLITPYAIAGLAAVIGLYTLWRWMRTQRTETSDQPVPNMTDYEAMLERDLDARR